MWVLVCLRGVGVRVWGSTARPDAPVYACECAWGASACVPMRGALRHGRMPLCLCVRVRGVCVRVGGPTARPLKERTNL